MYLLFIAFMTALPVFMYLARLSPQESGLASINRKTSALCQGGFPAFHTAMFYSGFALVASYISIVIFVGLGRHFFDRDSRNA
jgi:fatty acid desaturase